MADKIILEVSNVDPPELEGIHDIFMPEDPPWRMPIPIYRAGDRIGKPFMEVDPERVVAVVYSQEADTCAIFSEPDEVSLSIAEQLLDFVRHEMKKGRLPKDLPWQSGVGDVANAVLSGFIEDDFFSSVSIYSEVLQDTVLDLIDLGKVRAASGSALTLSAKARDRFFQEIYRYKEKIVLRSVEISNAPEVIARLGVLAVNTALEIDIYGQVNSTHVMGSQMMNGVGGSGDFERHGAVSFMVTPSTAKHGAISAIVPMVSHVDHSEHSVDVIITEYGLVDTRNLTPPPGGRGGDHPLRPPRVPRHALGLLPAGLPRHRRPRAPSAGRGLRHAPALHRDRRHAARPRQGGQVSEERFSFRWTARSPWRAA